MFEWSGGSPWALPELLLGLWGCVNNRNKPVSFWFHVFTCYKVRQPPSCFFLVQV